MKERVTLWITALSAFAMSIIDLLSKVGVL